jgi:hypothetical protein
MFFNLVDGFGFREEFRVAGNGAKVMKSRGEIQ